MGSGVKNQKNDFILVYSVETRILCTVMKPFVESENTSISKWL